MLCSVFSHHSTVQSTAISPIFFGASSSSVATQRLMIYGYMAWAFPVLSLIVLLVACLCKILHVSWFPSKVAFFNRGNIFQKKAFLVVIAHPDDESMFFTPTINYLTSRGHNVHILCLSTGNADGMGSVRKDELLKACAVLKIPVKQVFIVDHPELQDGFGKVWNHNLIAELIGNSIRCHGIDSVITFDRHGVSGHCNHRDVYFGVRKFLLDSQDSSFEAWELVSTNLVRKYSGPLDVWLSSYIASCRNRAEVFCLINEDPLKSFLAMAQHMSQWVWFRKLFVSFSSYTYVNTLVRIEV